MYLPVWAERLLLPVFLYYNSLRALMYLPVCAERGDQLLRKQVRLRWESWGHRRVKWTLGEIWQLVEGCDKHGVGNWQHILETGVFPPTRTAVDLKDKWRNLKLLVERGATARGLTIPMTVRLQIMRIANIDPIGADPDRPHFNEQPEEPNLGDRPEV